MIVFLLAKGGTLRAWVALVVALLITAGCSGEEAAKLTGELHYVRDGGFGGWHDEVTIYADRRAGLSLHGHAKREFTLSEKEFGKVAGSLDDFDFKRLPPESTNDQPVSDAFTHVVKYQGRRVRTEDFAVPPSLQPLLSELQKIIEEHRSN